MKNSMNITKAVSIFAIAIVVGLAASVVSAQSSGWQAPTVAPTGGNPPAPINAGASSQAKQGALSLGTANLPTSGTMLDVIGTISANALAVLGNVHITGTVQIDGGSPGAGKVLTSDANGLASWQTVSGGGGGGPSGPLLAPTGWPDVISCSGTNSYSGLPIKFFFYYGWKQGSEHEYINPADTDSTGYQIRVVFNDSTRNIANTTGRIATYLTGTACVVGTSIDTLPRFNFSGTAF